MRRLGSLAVAVSALGFLVGCGHHTSSTGAIAGSPPASAPTMPPRPRALPVAGLDACDLVPPSELGQQGLPARGEEEPPAPETPHIKVCEWTTFPAHPALTLAVFTVPDQDINRLLTSPGAELTSVSGFGAIDMTDGSSTLERSCGVRVDVAPLQELLVTYNVAYGDLPGQSHELMCQKAHSTAEAIIHRLSTTAN
jgi:hypothetical protein